MILVTGASGKTGRAVVAALASKGAAVRAWIRNRANASELKKLGATEIAFGSMSDREAFASAARDTEAIYHICPNVSIHEVEFGRNAIAAASSAGVQRFVFHSVLHPQIAAMPHHWDKMRVEELLFASGLAFTILQPTAYMQNLLNSWPEIVDRGVYRTAWSDRAPISLVDLDDVAEAAATVLTQASHEGATYEIVGTPALTPAQIAQVLSRQLERPVRAQPEAVSDWQVRARANGMGETEAERLALMSRYYDQHGLVGNCNVLRWLLGREPTSLANFVTETNNKKNWNT